jgi:hypothetical protein
MQKLFLLLITIFAFANISLAANEPEGVTVTKVSDGYIVNFRLPDFNQNIVTAEGEEYIDLSINSYGTTSEPGLPALPLVSFNLAVPFNLTKANFVILSQTEEKQQLKSKILPFQEPWPKNKPIADRPFTINRSYYNSPGKILPFVSASESFIIGGVKGFNFTINPFSYNPRENKLSLIREGSFKILVTNGEVNAKRSSHFNDYLQQVFVNYNITGGERGINYLIITAPEFEAGLSPFITHKSSGGYTVDVFNTTATGTTTTAIKTFIQQRYTNPLTKPEFVLFVGDVDKIPAWTGTGLGTPKTDLNYACLEGTDFFADVFVGRFSVTSNIELQNAINKTIHTEMNLALTPKKNAFMASTDNHAITEATHNYVINTYFQPAGYTSLKLYTYTYSATTAQLITALNDNQKFAIYSGHGSTTSWADGPVLSQAQVRALTNTVFPYVYSFACITGDFSYSECFGETWLRTTTGGASFYGSSVNSYWTEDDILEKVLIKAMFEDNITKVTPMFDKAKVYYVNHFGNPTAGSMTLRYLEMYNLMGDPSLETVRHIPPDNTPPEPITNLSVLNPTSNSLKLNWTAPYDSTVGGVTLYDIRYSTTAINEGNFNSAPQKVYPGVSDTAGTPRSFTVDSLNYNTTYYFAVKAKDMWGNTSAISNLPSFATLAAPQISVNPGSISLIMTPDSARQESINISNVCPNPSTLDYTVDLINNTFPGKLEVKMVPVNKAESDERSEFLQKDSPFESPGMSIKGHGGPDAFGYKWKDSNEPNGPQYVWNSITGTGTQVTNWVATGSSALDDGFAGPFPIGFNFKFYGETKTQLYIHTNGLILFVLPTASWITNSTIPGSSDPNAFIAPLWDDLDGRTQGTVHYKAEVDKFIIQYTNWQKYGASSSSFSFQIVLHKSGKITYYYNNLVGDVASNTVGIESPGGTTGLQVTYNAAYLTNNLAIDFAAEPEWLFTNNTSGTITSGNSTQFVLQVSTDGLELGNYSMDVRIKSNCAVNPEILVPVQLIVVAVPVEMVSFSAETVSDEVVVKWQTKTETNNNGFSIERKSVNDKEWKEAGFVKGHGTTTETCDYMFKDKPAAQGKYFYRLVQMDFDGSKSVSNEVEVDLNGPAAFELLQNYPNPFNPVTSIKYSLPVQSSVRLTIHNILGETVEVVTDNIQEAGYYEYTWNASSYASGIYICSIQAVAADGATSFSSLKKMVMIK